MSADDFQTKYSSVMESMLKSAIAETTKLFETMVDELKAEISRMKKENEDLKTRCSQFENARSQSTVDTTETEPLPGPRDGSEKRDRAVQCDLVPFRTVLVEQCQPWRHSSLQNQEQQCTYEQMEYSLQDHTYGEGTTQMAFILVKQEDSYDDSSPQSALKQEEVEPAVVCGLVLSDNAGPPLASACGTENEEPLISQECSNREIPLPQKDEETRVALELPCSGMDNGSQVAQNQLSELEHSLISLAAIKDNMDEESDVSCHQSEVEPLEKGQPSVAPQQCQREGEMTVNEQSDITLQQYTAVQSTEQQLPQPKPLNKGQACEALDSRVAEGGANPEPELSGRRRRGRPPKKAKRLQQPVKEISSPAISSLSTRFSSEKEKPSESQQHSMEMEDGAIQAPTKEVSSAIETLNTTDQPREHHTSVTLQDAMLLVEAVNQSTVDNPQMAAQLQTQCAAHVGTLRTVDGVPLGTPPLPATHKVAGNLPVTELSTTTQSTTEELDAHVTADVTPTNKAQAHVKSVVPKQWHTVTLANTTTSSVPSSTAAVQTSDKSQVKSLQQPPRLLITSVAPSKPGTTVSHKIIAVPRSVSSVIRHKIAALSPTQFPTVMSPVVVAQKNSTIPGLPLGIPSLSSVPQKTICVTTRKSLPVVPSQLAATSTDPQSGTSPRPKITIIIPRQVSGVVSRKPQSQPVVLTSKQELGKSAAPVTVSSSQQLSISVDTQTVLDQEATISSLKKGKTLVNLECPKQTDSVSEPINPPREACSSSNMSIGLVPTSVFPAAPPAVEQNFSAVVKLTRLPFPVSAKEAVLVSRLPEEMLVLPADIYPSLKETSETLSVQSQMSEHPYDIQQKASLSSGNSIILEKQSPDSRLSTPSKLSVPVFENSTMAINMTEPPSSSDEKIISIGVQVSASPNDPSIEEKQSVALIQLTPITTKDISDPHLQMTKAQFLAQLAVTPVTEDLQKASNDSVEVTACCAETSTSEKKRLQKESLMTQLRSHLRNRLPARRTEANPESCTETETHTVSPKKHRLENVSPKDKNTTREPIALSPEDLGVVEDVTSPKKTTYDPALHSARRSGLFEVCVGPKKNVSEPTSVSARMVKTTKKSTSVSSRRSSSSVDGVGSKTKKSTSMSPSRSSSNEESASPNNTKSTSVSPRRFSAIKENDSPKKTVSTLASPRRSSSTKENTTSKTTRNISVRPRRISSTKDGAGPKGDAVPKSTKTTSVSPKRTNLSKDDASPQHTKSSVSPRTSGLSKNGTSPKESTNESTSFCRRRCTLPKDDSTSKQIKRESNPFSARYSITIDDASTKITKSEPGSPSVRWPKMAEDRVSPRKTKESTPAKKPRLIQDGTGPKENFSVVDAKKLAKAKTTSQSKLQNGAKTSHLAENHASCEVVRKCIAKAIWTPPRMPVSTTALAEGKKETKPPTSQDHTVVYPPSVPLLPIPVRAPPVVSPLQPLSVIGRRLLKNQCGECGRVLSSVAALESHVSLHAGRRPFSCSLCGKRFPDSKGLKRHGRVHRNGRIHICQQCGKGFVYRFGLTKHLQMVHRRIKPFICQICNKGFFTKRDVEAHIRMHTGEKPFHCNLCEKKFARRVELNVHLRWHNGEKRHWCPFCGKGFLDFNNLKRHKYIHTGEKPHSCPHCPKNFTQSGHLKKHVKNVHKIL